MARPDTHDEWVEDLRKRSDKDVIAFRDLRNGGVKQQAGMTVWQEREDAKNKKIRDEEFQRQKDLLETQQKKEEEHTLLVYWKLANWQERFGMIAFFWGIFIFGFLCSKMNLASRVIDLIRDVIP